MSLIAVLKPFKEGEQAFIEARPADSPCFLEMTVVMVAVVTQGVPAPPLPFTSVGDLEQVTCPH